MNALPLEILMNLVKKHAKLTSSRIKILEMRVSKNFEPPHLKKILGTTLVSTIVFSNNFKNSFIERVTDEEVSDIE